MVLYIRDLILPGSTTKTNITHLGGKGDKGAGKTEAAAGGGKGEQGAGKTQVIAAGGKGVADKGAGKTEAAATGDTRRNYGSS